MTIALKILAFISACGIAIFDFSKFQIISQNPYYFDQIISYYFLPAGLMLSLFYFAGLSQKKGLKKASAVLLMVFSGLHLALKVADIFYNLYEHFITKSIDYEFGYQFFIWLSQIVLLTSFFILGLSCFKNKLRSVAAYLLIASVIAHLACYGYYIYSGGFSLSQLVDSTSEIFFIIPQTLVLLGYIGIYFKEVWIENEVFK